MYAVIHDDGTVTTVNTPPTHDLIDGHLIDMAGEPILTRESLAAWTGDNFQARYTAGEVRRNPVGAVFIHGVLGANPDPIAGPVVITGLDRDPVEGYLPASLDALEVEAVGVLCELLRTIRDGGPVPEDVPTEVVLELAVLLQAAVANPFRGPELWIL